MMEVREKVSNEDLQAYLKTLVEKSKVAQKQFERDYTKQRPIDEVVRAIGKAVCDNGKTLGEEAFAETGMGNVESKIAKLTNVALLQWVQMRGKNSVEYEDCPGEPGVKYLPNILIVAIVCIAMHIYLRYSKHGYEIAVVGESENTAHYIGIDVKKVIIRTMALSGAICGLAGLLLVGGSSHSIDSNLVDGRGFTAIMVSWLAKFDPFTMILTTLLLVFLARGADEVTSKFGLNSDFSEILTGIILFFIIGCEFFINYQVHFNYHKKEKTASAAVSGEGN